jgi:hypothetical protein
MLPGFRFLLAAVVLSVSIVTFGLGAAALLRAAHEEFASIPARRITPEPYFAQATEPPAPTLAMLRVDPALQDNAPASPPAPGLAEEPAPEAVPVPKVDVEKLAALSVEVTPPAEPAKPEAAASEPPAAAQLPVAELSPVAAPSTEERPAEAKVAALDAAPAPVIDTMAPPIELIVLPAMTDGSIPIAAVKPATKTAALSKPAAAVESEVDAKKKAERAELKKKERAERAKERRRLAARRARLAAQQAAAATPTAAIQQPANLFGDVTPQTPPATRRR